MQIRTSIIGASGYTGIELIRLLQQHPKAQLAHLVSPSNSGHNISDIYPHLTEIIYDKFDNLDIEKIADDSDIIFMALPHGEALQLIPHFLNKHCKIIDLSADMRINDGKTYSEWYNVEHHNQDLLDAAVYGLPEIYVHEKISRSAIIANPGCYPTATILGLAPLLHNNLIDTENKPLIIDAKSGVSGAGRSLSLATHFCEAMNNFTAYQIGGIHRHIPEIEQELSKLAKRNVQIQFTPHLIPMPRGMMVTTYCHLNNNFSIGQIEKIFQEYYFGKPFVRIMSNQTRASVKSVIGSNYCDIYLYLDLRTNYLTVISCIDNLIKGASGQAIQNMNILSGLHEDTGLQNIPSYP